MKVPRCWYILCFPISFKKKKNHIYRNSTRKVWGPSTYPSPRFTHCQYFAVYISGCPYRHKLVWLNHLRTSCRHHIPLLMNTSVCFLLITEAFSYITIIWFSISGNITSYMVHIQTVSFLRTVLHSIPTHPCPIQNLIQDRTQHLNVRFLSFLYKQFAAMFFVLFLIYLLRCSRS